MKNDNLACQRTVSRRSFLKVAGSVAMGIGVSGFIKLADGRSAIPVSEGYLVVDEKKCQGCLSCMLACSLVHEGVENLSLARIQILQNSFNNWPEDLNIEQCRQCVDPNCVEACPEGALSVDAKSGQVRRIVDKDACIGCGSCVEACPYTPSRTLLAPDESFDGAAKARICDLCTDAPYHWDPKGGGPKGKQACVEVCPLGAIQFTAEIPEQEGDSGYKVNLRDTLWLTLGFPIN